MKHPLQPRPLTKAEEEERAAADERMRARRLASWHRHLDALREERRSGP